MFPECCPSAQRLAGPVTEILPQAAFFQRQTKAVRGGQQPAPGDVCMWSGGYRQTCGFSGVLEARWAVAPHRPAPAGVLLPAPARLVSALRSFTTVSECSRPQGLAFGHRALNGVGRAVWNPHGAFTQDCVSGVRVEAPAAS